MNSPHGIVTIIAKNYLAAARVLCRSAAEHNPGVRLYVLFVDEISGFIKPADEPFQTVTLDEIGIPNFDRGFCFKYDVTELSTAVKPFLLEHLLKKHNLTSLLYLDPDILVTAPLTGLFQELEQHDMVITPHLDTDYPDDGRAPDLAHIMTSGVYNLGFIGVSGRPPTMEFLRWWQGKLYEHCIIDHARGFFVDQRFVDIALSLFSGFGVERDTGYNTAYWNLHSRRIGQAEGRWTCNGGPMYFFHFSNYKPERPDRISGHQDRFTFESRPDVRPIFDEYRQRLFAEGYEQARKWPYGWGTFDNGQLIRKQVRRVYLRADAQQRQSFGDPFASPRLKRLNRLVNAARWLKRTVRAPIGWIRR